MCEKTAPRTRKHRAALSSQQSALIAREKNAKQSAGGGIHTTPAMAVDLTDRVWKLEDIVAIVVEQEKKAS